MAGPSKHAHLLVNLACAEVDVEEQYTDIGTKEESKILHFEIHYLLRG
jgi:hypothetical protein